MLPNSAWAKPGSRNSSWAEDEYCLGERSDSASASPTLTITTVITISRRRHSTDSSSNGETVESSRGLSQGIEVGHD